MSYDTMASHDDGLDEAKAIVRAELPLNLLDVITATGTLAEMKFLKGLRRRLLSRIERLKQNK